jgi:hypothetical protein
MLFLIDFWVRYMLKDVPANGECGYEAYLDQIRTLVIRHPVTNGIIAHTAEEMRLALVDVVLNPAYQNLFNRRLIGDDEFRFRWTLISDLNNKSPRIWAGMDTHLAFALLCNRALVVLAPSVDGVIEKYIYLPDAEGMVACLKANELPTEAPIDAVVIAYVGNNHYMSVVPK